MKCALLVNSLYPDGDQGRLVSRTSAHVLRVEGGVLLAHERGLEDVATAAVGQEPPPVQIHLLSWGLEVQRHCTKIQTSRLSLSMNCSTRFPRMGLSDSGSDQVSFVRHRPNYPKPKAKR